MEIVDEILAEFLVESYENLDQLDRDLLGLEETPDDKAALSSVFRSIHTIKGTSGFLAFPKLEKVAHAGESLLADLRDGELILNEKIANALLTLVDAIRSMLSSIESGNGEGDESFQSLIDELARLKHGKEETPSASTATVQPTVIEAFEVVEELQGTTEQASHAAPPETPEPVSEAADSASASPPDASTATDQHLDSGARANSAPNDETATSSVADSTVRIEVGLLDKLMNLVGELVLARNEIMQFSQNTDDSALSAASQRVNLITTELQEGVMKTRMQPIRNAWSKLPRVVRDLSRTCGKEVQVKMEGAETELDKTILEAIRDPLTHIVRNSVDHGIETREDRVAAGKSPVGTLLLRAFHEGGQVNIEIVDDGSGIAVDRIRSMAVEKGLVSAQQASALSDREASQLILLPGFSTAATVTNISGRGVGMDVVKTNVENIGGTLDINSVPGEGTTLRIKIPLTLAIVPALVVTCDGDRFCIPQVNLLELVRLEADDIQQRIEVLHSVPVYRLRGKLLPLVYLDEELGLRARRTGADRCKDNCVNIVVLQAEDQKFGLVVDSISDTQEIVVKSLGMYLKDLPVYAGSTIMGDGTVSLILDVVGIARKSHVIVEHRGRRLMEADEIEFEPPAIQACYLVVDPGDNSRAAIRLASVARLEEISTEHIESTGHQQVVQYRDRIMPLVSLNAHSEVEASDEAIPIIVYNTGECDVGVVVGQILDIVDQADTVSTPDGSSQVIGGKVTRVVDLQSLAAGVA